jgi:hypothetical protein
LSGLSPEDVMKAAVDYQKKLAQIALENEAIEQSSQLELPLQLKV